MATESNNDYLADLANEERGYHETNNQLLRKIVLGGGNGGSITKKDIDQSIIYYDHTSAQNLTVTDEDIIKLGTPVVTRHITMPSGEYLYEGRTVRFITDNETVGGYRWRLLTSYIDPVGEEQDTLPDCGIVELRYEDSTWVMTDYTYIPIAVESSSISSKILPFPGVYAYTGASDASWAIDTPPMGFINSNVLKFINLSDHTLTLTTPFGNGLYDDGEQVNSVPLATKSSLELVGLSDFYVVYSRYASAAEAPEEIDPDNASMGEIATAINQLTEALIDARILQ